MFICDTMLPFFAYGTLSDETLVDALLERKVSSESARLLGFELLTLEKLGYPTLFAAEDSAVEGILFRGVEEEDYQRLDAYEGVGEGLYRRIEADISVPGDDASTSARERAYVYVATEKTLERFL